MRGTFGSVAGSGTGKTLPPMVGRGAELQELCRSVAASPSLTLVEGEAGIGKTRLITELISHPCLSGFRILMGRAQRLREPFLLGPVIEAIRSGFDDAPATDLGPLTGALRPLIPEIGGVLPPTPEALQDSRAERHRVFRALVEVADALAPAVLVLEDVHWADEETVEFLEFAAARVRKEVSFLVSYRREDLPRSSPVLTLPARSPDGRRLCLDPLDLAATTDLIAAVFGTRDVSAEFAAYIHAHSSGIPFAIEELLLLMKQRGDVALVDGRWQRRPLHGVEVPKLLQDSILERTSQLSADAREVLDWAAVVEVAAGQELISHVCGLDTERCALGISEAIDCNVLHESGNEVEFRHRLARHAVYTAIPSPRRRRLHLAVARTLAAERSPALGRIAHHFREAGAVEEWASYARAAAARAASLHDDASAFRFLLEPVEAPGLSLGQLEELALQMAEAALAAVAHVEAIPVVRRVLERNELAPVVQGRLRLKYAFLLDQAGDVSQSLAQTKIAVKELAIQPDLAASAMRLLSLPWSVELTFDEHLEWADRAAEAADRCDDPAVKLAVSVNRASLLLFAGDRRAASEVSALPDDAATRDEKKQLLRSKLNFAQGALYAGHYGSAASFLDAGFELCADLRDEWAGGLLESTGLLLRWATGEWEGLAAHARQIRAKVAEIPSASVEADFVLGNLCASSGNTDDARRILHEVADTATATGAIPLVASAVACLARVHSGESGGGTGWAMLSDAVELIRCKGIWIWGCDVVPEAVRALLVLNKFGDAQDLTTEFADGIDDKDAPAARAALAECRAHLDLARGRPAAAISGFTSAQREWAALPRPFAAARVQEVVGRCLVATASPHAKRALADALAAFDALGATWDASRVRRAMREAGFSLPRPGRSGRRGYGASLSPREAEISKLAATGLSNKEIADRLFLAPGTVANHLLKAMHKQGLNSRKALIARHRDEVKTV